MDATALLADLADRGCRFVVIGSTARALQGGSKVPADLDLVVASDQQNLDRAMEVLAEHGGRLERSRRRVRLDAPHVARHDLWRVMTVDGPVDVIVRFPDGCGFEEYAETAADTNVADVGTVLIEVTSE